MLALELSNRGKQEGVESHPHCYAEERISLGKHWYMENWMVFQLLEFGSLFFLEFCCGVPPALPRKTTCIRYDGEGSEQHPMPPLTPMIDIV
jgi:hypothetical protein